MTRTKVRADYVLYVLISVLLDTLSFPRFITTLKFLVSDDIKNKVSDAEFIATAIF